MNITNKEQVEALQTIKTISGISEQFDVTATFQLADGRTCAAGDTLNINTPEQQWTPEQIHIFKTELNKLDTPDYTPNKATPNPFDE
jgi:hypothetical protein